MMIDNIERDRKSRKGQRRGNANFCRSAKAAGGDEQGEEAPGKPGKKKSCEKFSSEEARDILKEAKEIALGCQQGAERAEQA